MRLNSQTGIEGLPVSSLNCDRPLRPGIRVPETVMSMGGQITDSVRKCTMPVTVAPESAMTSPVRRAAYGSLRLSGHRHRGLH